MKSSLYPNLKKKLTEVHELEPSKIIKDLSTLYQNITSKNGKLTRIFRYQCAYFFSQQPFFQSIVIPQIKNQDGEFIIHTEG